jgi:SAF domain
MSPRRPTTAPAPGPLAAPPSGTAPAKPARGDGRLRLATRRRRRGTRVAAGVATVLVCLFGFLAASSAVLGRHTTRVLALARPVPAGAVLTAADLAVVAMPPAPGVVTVSASAQAQVAGRTAAVPLAAGTLLTGADLGAGRFPPAGKAVLALSLKTGAFPPGLQPGARVAVLPGATPPGSGVGQQPQNGSAVAVGVVTAIASGGGADPGQVVVSVLVDTPAAAAVEQLPAPVLVQLNPAGSDVP